MSSEKISVRLEDPVANTTGTDGSGAFSTAPSSDETKIEMERDVEASPPPPSPSSSSHIHGVKLVLIMSSIVACLFLVALDQTIVATAIPRITDEFGGLDKESWYGTAYFMTFAGFIAPWGKAIRYFSLRWTYLLALFIFELGSLMCGVAPNANVLIAGRAVAGAGCAGVATVTFLTVALIAPPQKQPLLLGILAAVYGVAAACGPLMGGAFTEKLSWRWCFYINLPVGGAAAVLILIFFSAIADITVSASPREILIQMDLTAVVILMGAIVTTTLALQYGGQTMPWNSSDVIGLLVGGALLTAAFFLWEAWLAERAMIILRLAKQRRVWAGSVYQLLFGAAFFVTLYYLPIYFQSVRGVSPLGSGVRNLPLVLGQSISSIVCGGLLAQYGGPLRLNIVMTVAACFVTVACGLFYSLDSSSSSGRWIGFQIIGGASWGAAWQCSLVLAHIGQVPTELGVVTAVVLLLQNIGGVIGLAVAQCIFNNRLIELVKSTAPTVDASKILIIGATKIRTEFHGAELAGVIAAYLGALQAIWIVAIAMAGLAVIFSLILGFK